MEKVDIEQGDISEIKNVFVNMVEYKCVNMIQLASL